MASQRCHHQNLLLLLFSFSFYSSRLTLLLLVFAFSPLVIGQDNASQPLPTPINRDLYHTSESFLEEIEALVHRHPDKLSVEKISSTNKGYNAEVTVVTYCRLKKDCDDKSKFRILLTFGQHGRELITTELALRILSILSEEEFLPTIDRASLNETLDRLVIKIVPMENLNGRKLVEAGDLCERRNGRGVDLNRNWSVDWGKKEKDYDPYEENPGTSPFSEPETQIMRKLSLSFEPYVWANVHSGMEALFMPYDHKNTTPDGLVGQRMSSVLENLNHAHFKDLCVVGSGGAAVGHNDIGVNKVAAVSSKPFTNRGIVIGTTVNLSGTIVQGEVECCLLGLTLHIILKKRSRYLAHGTATDFMFDIAKVPMPFTFEIYGDINASNMDCFKMFNPVDITTFNKVVNDWSAAFFGLFKLGVAQHVEGLIRSGGNQSSSLDKLISIDDYLNSYLMERRNRYGKKTEVFDLGMQEIRTYFRLFLLSSVLLMFMFCSRIVKTTRPNVFMS